MTVVLYVVLEHVHRYCTAVPYLHLSSSLPPRKSSGPRPRRAGLPEPSIHRVAILKALLISRRRDHATVDSFVRICMKGRPKQAMIRIPYRPLALTRHCTQEMACAILLSSCTADLGRYNISCSLPLETTRPPGWTSSTVFRGGPAQTYFVQPIVH